MMKIKKLKYKKECNKKKLFKNSRKDRPINYIKKINVDSLKGDQKEFVQKLIIKAQQRFKSERQCVFTEVIHKIALSSNGAKRMQSGDLMETYARRTCEDLICKKREN